MEASHHEDQPVDPNATPQDQQAAELKSLDSAPALKEGITYDADRSPVLTLSRRILADPLHVELHPERMDRVAEVLVNDCMGEPEPHLPPWNWPPNFPASEDFEEMSKFYLLFDAINACYFHLPAEQADDGAYTLRAFKDGDLIEEGLVNTRLTQHWEQLQDTAFLKDLPEDFARNTLFKAEVEIPLLEERITAMREVGAFLHESRQNPNIIRDLFAAHDNDALEIAKALPEYVPSYADAFLKRTQLFVAMVQGRFANDPQNPIRPETLRDVTGFSDYLCPVSIVASGTASISDPELLRKIRAYEEIPKGSTMELELRALTPVVFRELRDRIDMIRGDQKITGLHLDFPHWFYGRPEQAGGAPEGFLIKPLEPHHNTITMDY